MKRITSVIVGVLVISVASAATPASVSSSPVGPSTLAQRILLRKEQRLHKHGSSSSSATPAIFVRPSRRSSSSSSYSYTGTPVRGVLQIDQVAMGTNQQIVGTVPYTLLSFDATAANEDIVLSGVKFHAEQGNLATGTQYALNTVTSTGGFVPIAYAMSSGETLAFTDIDTIIHRGTTRRFALRARLLTSDASLAVGFLTTDPLFIQAQGLQYGRDLAPGIQVDTIPCTGPYICRVIVHTQPALLLHK